MGLAHSPKIVTDGLVLALDAGNVKSYPGSGTTWYDKSGFGNNGALTNGPTFATGSIVFDGTNDYVDCGSSSFFNLGNNFTLESWVYPTEVGSQYGDEIFSLTTGNPAPYISYGLEWMDTYKFRFSLGNTGNSFLNYNSTSTYTLNGWYHVVGSYNGSTVILYVNGILQNTTNISTTIKYSENRLTIGAWYYGISPSNSLKGNISTIKLYNKALTSDEVLQNYNATKGRFGL